MLNQPAILLIIVDQEGGGKYEPNIVKHVNLYSQRSRVEETILNEIIIKSLSKSYQS